MATTLLRLAALVGVAAYRLCNTAFAADCVASSNPASPAKYRALPSATGAVLGSLTGQAPLHAIVPNWYETRTSNGAVAFVSKRAADIVACNGLPPGTTGQAIYELHAIDVGTGLAVFVRGPDFSLLFDAGSNDDLAKGDKNRALAYLRLLNPAVTKIDHVFLSHPHRDHVELLADIINAFPVDDAWNSGAYNDICGYRTFISAVASKPSIRYHTATQSGGDESITFSSTHCEGLADDSHPVVIHHADRITNDSQPLGSSGTASMTILHADGTTHANLNENSLVVRLDLGSHRILLVGDAEAGGRQAPAQPATADSIEGKLLACCIDQLKADVLVMGHHGSKTSSRSTFIDAIGAKTYVISSGPKKYGSVVLPDPEIVAEAVAHGDVFRTDIDDDQCAAEDQKVGPDHDGKAGGCNNVVLTIPAAGAISGRYNEASD